MIVYTALGHDYCDHRLQNHSQEALNDEELRIIKHMWPGGQLLVDEQTVQNDRYQIPQVFHCGEQTYET